MAKEKKYNPVQAQRKADKAKEIKKGKADLQAKRNEKLAQRNPERVQRQIDDLKAIKTNGGTLTSVEEQSLEALEKDLKAIKKAREALGDRAPTLGRGPPGAARGSRDGHGSGVLGKRRRDFEDPSSSDDSDVPEDVKKIPMPRDTPPPIPKEIMDEWWAKRRAKRNTNASTNANAEPMRGNRLGDRDRPQSETPTATTSAPGKPVVESKVVYEAKPVIRDLQKEAVSAFVPTNVRIKLDKGKGHGGLMEPEEADELERAGYLRSAGAASQQPVARDDDQATVDRHRNVTMEDVDDEDEG